MEESFFKLEFIEELNLSHLTFLKKCTSDQYRLAYGQLVELFKSKGHHNHITDTSTMGVIGVEDQQWVKANVVPNMRKFADSTKKLNIALILGDDIFATFAAKNIARNFMDKQNIDIHYFAGETEAFDWFKEESALAA
ncbi:hypothetical protein [Flexithrix dorotheae]|uniref:hypothetical protein n=1 Tax=Flexithrix dorotheae TaxID=70993 RepID=UPI00036825D4|nr:hypothetical protein [Flexithrix dorotheae]